MAVLSSFDFWLPFMILAAVIVLFRGGFRARAMVVCLLLSITLLEGLFVNPLKTAFGRPRPTDVLDRARIVGLAEAKPKLLALGEPARVRPAKVRTPPKPGKSFPSGHTANMFCFATILAVFYRPRGAWFYLVAILVGVSRIMTGSHWPSDVLLTAALTVPLSLGLIRCYELIWQKWAPRLAPALAAQHPQLIAKTG